jgi:hypothetical protein
VTGVARPAPPRATSLFAKPPVMACI